MKLLCSILLLVVISLVNAYVPSDFETDKIVGIKLNLNNNLKNKAGSFGEDRYNVTVQVLQYASDSQSVERNDLSIDYLQQMYPPFSCILNGWHLLEAK
ncbi:hypothetical protein TYRP_015157 [Tyrophagus putrescentiae]|nr:hypothetical protein TYRP_015157 [Tyrophagus putrescentiae]